MPPPGGSANLNGVLYQILHSLHWVGALTLSAQCHDGELSEATLLLEPSGGGGDLRISDDGLLDFVVEQYKSAPLGSPWSLNDVIQGVLPDLYLAIPDDRLAAHGEYRFVTPGKRGDWLNAASFFASLAPLVPADPRGALDDANVEVFGRGTSLTRRQLFDQIIETLQESPRIGKETRLDTERKLWHLLSRFRMIEHRTADSLVQSINQFLLSVVDNREDVDHQRRALSGFLLERAAAGPYHTIVAQLLAEVGLRGEPLINVSRVRARIRARLEMSFKELRYRPEEDVRARSASHFEKPVLLITGESGQGKSWLECAVARKASEDGAFVALFAARGDADRDWDEASRTIWQQALGHTALVPIEELHSRLRDLGVADGASRLVVCIDDVHSVHEARRVIAGQVLRRDIQVVMTVPAPTARVLATEFPDRVEIRAVTNFTLPELQSFMELHGRDWAVIPSDVQETCRLPLLARMFTEVSAGTWTPSAEYEIFEKYWSRLSVDREQIEHPADVGRMAALAISALDDNVAYPWTSEHVAFTGIDDDARKRLEAVGWLQRLPDGRARVFHDRLLNWAVAEALVRDLEQGLIEPSRLHALLIQFDRPTTTTRRPALPYVPMDVLWLCTDPAHRLQQHVSGLVQALEHDSPDSLYTRLLPTLGRRAIPLLLDRLRESDDRLTRLISTGLSEIGRIAPDDVQRSAVTLIHEPTLDLQRVGLQILAVYPLASALDRLWLLHEESVNALDDKDNRDRWSRYEATSSALRSTVPLQLDWLARRIEDAHSDQPAWELAYLLASLQTDQGNDIWASTKQHLLSIIPDREARSLVACIRRFRDRSEIRRLQTWIGSDVDLIAPSALTALADISPKRAIDSLERVPLHHLLPTRGWWLPKLLVRSRAETLDALRILIDADQATFWSRAMVFDDRELEIDSRTLNLLLDRLTHDVDSIIGSPPAEGQHPVYRPVELLKGARSHQAVDAFRQRRNTATESQLAQLASSWVRRSPGFFDHEKHAAFEILVRIGGPGATQFINAELASGDFYATIHGLDWCLFRPDETTIELLTAVARDATASSVTSGAPHLQAKALIALAALGQDSTLMEVVLRWGGDVLQRDLLEILPQRPPATDEVLSEALRLVHSADPDQQAKAIVALGVSRRADIVPTIRAIFDHSDNAAVTKAVLIALELLGDRDDSLVPRLARELAVPNHRELAIQALFRVGTPAALAELESAAGIATKSQTPDEGLLAALQDASPDRARVERYVWELAQARSSDYPLSENWLEAIGGNPDSQAIERLWRAAFPVGRAALDREQLGAVKGLRRGSPELALKAAELLTTEQSETRAVMPEIMMELDPARAVAVLAEVIIEETDPVMRWAIARALRLGPSQTSQAAVSSMLNSADLEAKRAGADLAGWFYQIFESELQRLATEETDEELLSSIHAALSRQVAESSARALITRLPKSEAVDRWALINDIIELTDPFLLTDSRDPYGFLAAMGNVPGEIRLFVRRRIEEREKELEKEAGSIRFRDNKTLRPRRRVVS